MHGCNIYTRLGQLTFVVEALLDTFHCKVGGAGTWNESNGWLGTQMKPTNDLL